ncbi:MAG: tetratricopeptide repeat protein [Deltaproteobacteria bacterium]|nr:tetratricopeptide repeat protein [Deltaproteobacteria bacterium]
MTRLSISIATLTFMLCVLPKPARAVQWQGLTATSRHQVALDEESVRLTQQGRLAVWLRFTPLGNNERKDAGKEYGEKGYRSHLEYYEIDCSEQNAILGLIDIFGTGRARLKRLKGGELAEIIIPGSVLDLAAQKICPVLEEEEIEEEREEPAPVAVEESESVPAHEANPETAQKIKELLSKTAIEPSNPEAWTLLGNAYFDADRPDDAIAAYNKALALRPEDANILNDQGAMYRQKGDFTRALANFEKAFKIDPYNLESLYNSGYVYAFDLNDIPKALQIWKRYLELDKNSETARQVESFVERYQK